MRKLQTKNLFNEVSNHLQSNYGFHIEIGYSDYNNKSSVIRKNPDCPLRDNEINFWDKGSQNYFGVCEFSVLKKGRKEFFVIWDYRENQPYNKSIHCVNSEFSFGRYEFTDRDSFYNHITTDFGLTIWDRKILEESTKNQTTFSDN